ncbi:MAG: hypothetical protein NVS4B2_03170 [Chloroflexota bacterium]
MRVAVGVAATVATNVALGAGVLVAGVTDVGVPPGGGGGLSVGAAVFVALAPWTTIEPVMEG